ncbi:hypothetical protein AGMMS49960_03050 [Betaproteobacteria bacterium]|nr:hypothetical protein AGMMS49543_01850 [Betaproteobacteria bacterium]GHT98947.1 hypothetical protein AGMMS49960_03050 [Betaproteobacteria bacterium]GHU19616.1 hypothetical protein AGMMS50243_12050 [Betaproteobacteria bacterium]
MIALILGAGVVLVLGLLLVLGIQIVKVAGALALALLVLPLIFTVYTSLAVGAISFAFFWQLWGEAYAAGSFALAGVIALAFGVGMMKWVMHSITRFVNRLRGLRFAHSTQKEEQA